MRQLPIVIIALVLTLGTPAASQAPQANLPNVAALARLYGVVRYFYPSDAAAALDWNRFAVHAAKQARAARNPKELEAVLEALFIPLGPGIEIGSALQPPRPAGAPNPALVAWRYFGAGLTQAGNLQGPYRAKRTNRPVTTPGTIDGFATRMQVVPALNLRGHSIRLRGMVRADARETNGSAALWLRVDRADQQMGFFDNMGDRPVRDRGWREYTIEGTVADDATSIALGVSAVGAVSADFDAINLESRAPGGAWMPVSIKDPGFEGAASSGWMPAGTSKRVIVSYPTDQAAEGKLFLRLAAPAGSVSTDELFTDAPPLAGAHVDVDLGAGLTARVPLSLSEAEASSAGASDALDTLKTALSAVPDAPGSTDVHTRLADVVVAWNVFRHFYPYWTEAGVDWNARLLPLLETAYAATTREQHRDALKRLVADVRDGHGGVTDTRNRTPGATLPIRLGVIENQIVITASDAQAELPIGAIVTRVDGAAAGEQLARLRALASGTTQWKQARALNEMVACDAGARVPLVFDTGAGTRTTTLTCEGKPQPAEKRPDPVSKLAAGIWYIDLTRARMQQIASSFDTIAAAKGVVFDVRGYPTDAGAQILPHLLAGAERDRWMHVGKIVGPYGAMAGWESLGWNMLPVTPRITGRAVFLTDGRAISYAESVMGYVADRKLGTIIGSPTAGTNGNVAAFVVPGGFSLTFTGMRVTRHDGTTAHHLIGVQPDIALIPTIAAVKAGRDELIERAVAVIEGR
jgi:Peptidase family S41